MVLGEGLARLLAARVGDELVVLMQAADSSMGDDRLRVVGVARTGTSALDRQAAWMRQGDLAWLAGVFLLVNVWFSFVIANRSETSIAAATRGEGVNLKEAGQESHHEGLNMFEELCWINALANAEPASGAGQTRIVLSKRSLVISAEAALAMPSSVGTRP